MSSFNAGAVTGQLKFDTTQYSSSMSSATATAKAFAPVIAQSVDAPLVKASGMAAAMAQSLTRIWPSLGPTTKRIELDTTQAIPAAHEAAAAMEKLAAKSNIKGTATVDASGVSKGMFNAEAMMSAFPGWVTAFLADPLIGFAVIAKDAFAAVIKAIKAVLEEVVTLGNQFHQAGVSALRLGVGVEWFDRLRVAAHEAGIETQSLEQGIRGIQMRAGMAADGDEGAAKAFARIGIDVGFLRENLDNVPALFDAVRSHLDGLSNNSERLAAAQKLMRGAGSELIPLLAMSGAEIDKLNARAQRLGATLSSGDVASGAKFHELETAVEDAWTGITRTVTRPILDVFAKSFDKLMPVIERLAEIIRGALGKAMEVVTPWFQYLVDHAGALIPVMQEVGEVISTVWGVVSGAADSIGALLLPLLEALLPVLEAVGEAVKTIADAAAIGLNGFAAMVHHIAGDTTAEDKAMKRADAARDRLIGDVGMVGDGAGSTWKFGSRWGDSGASGWGGSGAGIVPSGSVFGSSASGGGSGGSGSGGAAANLFPVISQANGSIMQNNAILQTIQDQLTPLSDAAVALAPMVQALSSALSPVAQSLLRLGGLTGSGNGGGVNVSTVNVAIDPSRMSQMTAHEIAGRIEPKIRHAVTEAQSRTQTESMRRLNRSLGVS